jgi:hypothetical protein
VAQLNTSPFGADIEVSNGSLHDRTHFAVRHSLGMIPMTIVAERTARCAPGYCIIRFEFHAHKLCPSYNPRVASTFVTPYFLLPPIKSHLSPQRIYTGEWLLLSTQILKQSQLIIMKQARAILNDRHPTTQPTNWSSAWKIMHDIHHAIWSAVSVSSVDYNRLTFSLDKQANIVPMRSMPPLKRRP